MLKKWMIRGLIGISILTGLIYIGLLRRNNNSKSIHREKDSNKLVYRNETLVTEIKHVKILEVTMKPKDKNTALPNIEPPPMSDASSVGLGEGGEPVHIQRYLLSPEEQKEYDTTSKNITMINVFVSDRISVRRYLPDKRDNICKRKFEDLPNTSVIITFHNEVYSLLLRTIHSVIDRSDPNLLKEIILVDDASDYDYINGKLQNYLAYLNKVKLIRLKQRSGLIRARIAGIKIATGDTLTFLDSHCECLPGWLEPLLEQVKLNKTRIAEPELLNIAGDDFRIEYKNEPWVGKFDWALNFWWDVPYNELIENQKKGNYHDIIPSTALVGGVFLIHSEFFKSLRYWDDQLEFYGYENMELSFKTWMCGGSIYKVPCSIVGHAFHDRRVFNWKGDLKVQKRNRDRVAEVWLDDYKKFVYLASGPKTEDLGEIQHLIDWRKNNNCHDFDWFMNNINVKRLNPKYAVYSGVLRNIDKELCMIKENPITTRKCYKPINDQLSSAVWYLTAEGDLYSEELCLNLRDSAYPFLEYCTRRNIKNRFTYNQTTHQLISEKYGCLKLNGEDRTISVIRCDEQDRTQMWMWGF